MGISLQQQSSQQPMDEDQPTKQGEKQNKKETKCTVQVTRNNKQYKQLTDEHHKIRLWIKEQLRININGHAVVNFDAKLEEMHPRIQKDF